MIEAWRIAKTKDVSKAFSGEGSRLYGGRWNHKGVAAVYAAATRSLAMLEVIAHVRNSQQTAPPIPYMFLSVTLDEPDRSTRARESAGGLGHGTSS